MTPAVELVRPGLDRLARYVDALERGWSPDNVRGRAAAEAQLAAIAADPAGFVAGMEYLQGGGAPVILPDGREVRRLPGFVRWIWDGDFCGSINLRWPPRGEPLPETALGHVGYAVVPWKAGRGYATRALALLLDEARGQGLDHLDFTTDPGNLASQKVILANGGRVLERFRKPDAYGGAESLRLRIDL